MDSLPRRNEVIRVRSNLFIAVTVFAVGSATLACRSDVTLSAGKATLVAKPDSIMQLDTVHFVAHLGNGMSPLGWKWIPDAKLGADPWTKACPGADTICVTDIHGTGTMYYRYRVADGRVDSVHAMVRATLPPDIGDEPSDLGSPPPPAVVGCWRFEHDSLPGAFGGIHMDRTVVRLLNDIFYWEGPHLPLHRLQPAPEAMGVSVTAPPTHGHTSRWFLDRDTVWVSWGETPLILGANLGLHGDSLTGTLYVDTGSGRVRAVTAPVSGSRLECK